MGWFRKKYETAKTGVKEEFKHRQAVRLAEKQSYREAKMKAAKDFGKKKARYEEQQKFKKLKETKSVSFGGFAGPTQKKPSTSMGVSDYLLGGSGNGKKKKSNSMDELNKMLR